jgi:N-acetylglucosamine malate deacetylase 1
MPDSVLVLAAHPDDEVLGCGGALAKWVDAGARVHVAFLADGVFSREAEPVVQQ